MLTKNLFRSIALTFTVSFAGFAFAQLSEEQKEELYHKGTITIVDEQGNKKGHFEVRFMPGADNVTEKAKDHWENAVEVMGQLVKEDFWHKKMMRRFFDGLEFTKECCETGLCSLPGHLSQTLKDNRQLSGFGASGAKLKNWIEFGATCIGCTLKTTFGLVAGPVYSIVAPTGTLLYRPIKAGSEALFAGTLWPVMRYSFNGVAYALTRGNDEPKEGDFTVTYVPNRFYEEDVSRNNAFLDASDSCN